MVLMDDNQASGLKSTGQAERHNPSGCHLFLGFLKFVVVVEAMNKLPLYDHVIKTR